MAVGAIGVLGVLALEVAGVAFPFEQENATVPGKSPLFLKQNKTVAFSPAYGGSDCFGVPEEWKLCNTNPCPSPLGDIRAEQCDRLPSVINFSNSSRSGMQWLPYESDECNYR